MKRGQLSLALCSTVLCISVFVTVKNLNRSVDKLVLSGLNATSLDNGNAAPPNRNVAGANTGFIPKIVHQEWKTKDLTPNFKAWREECIRLNPGWDFRLWTDDENQKLVGDYYPEMLELYNSYDEAIKRIDMIRFLYLHRFGGVYMDLDILCLKPFGNFFDQYYDDYVVVNEYRNKVSLANAFMASSPRHALFEDIFRELPRHKAEIVFDATGGPFLQKHVLSQTSAHWVQLPMVLFYGQEWLQGLKNSPRNKYDMCESVDDCRRRYPNSITVSMWTGVWKKGGDDAKRQWKKKVTRRQP